MTGKVRRRAVLQSTLASAASVFSGGVVGLWSKQANGLGRFPLGGELSFLIPHDTSLLDPFDLFDPLAALIGNAVFESAYRRDRAGTVHASLADGLPTNNNDGTRVRLRTGLVSSRGRKLDAHDLVNSVERARRGGAKFVLRGVPTGKVDRSDPHVAVFPNADPSIVAQALASPLVVLASTASTSGQPDGTGAFRASLGRSELVLERNLSAASGAAFLRRIVIHAASDLKASLRAFEAKNANIGWLGAGLHRPRVGAVPFDFGNAGWIVLRTGTRAEAWNAPGVAQRLLDAIEPARLGHLGLGFLPPSSDAVAWAGPTCKLLAPARSAHLAEVASTLASILSRPGHEVETATLAGDDFAKRRESRDFALMVDVVRPIGPAGASTLLALAMADDEAQAKTIAGRPPNQVSYDPRVLTRNLRLGVVGGLRVAGAVAPPVVMVGSDDGAGWDLGAGYVRR